MDAEQEVALIKMIQHTLIDYQPDPMRLEPWDKSLAGYVCFLDNLFKLVCHEIEWRRKKMSEARKEE